MEFGKNHGIGEEFKNLGRIGEEFRNMGQIEELREKLRILKLLWS